MSNLNPCKACGSDRVTVWNAEDGQQAVCKDCKKTGPVFTSETAWRLAVDDWNWANEPSSADPTPSEPIMTTHTDEELKAARPITPLAAQTDAPAWMQIDMLFQRHGLTPPPYRLRDELVTMFTWAHYAQAAEARARTAEEALKVEKGRADRAERVLDWLTKNPNCELSHGCEDEESEGMWRVHRVNGGVNDREWTLISADRTPLWAIERAVLAEQMAALTTPTPADNEEA